MRQWTRPGGSRIWLVVENRCATPPSMTIVGSCTGLMSPVSASPGAAAAAAGSLRGGAHAASASTTSVSRRRARQAS